MPRTKTPRTPRRSRDQDAVVRLTPVAAAVMLLFASSMARAEDAATLLDKVEVTGSRIHRIDGETALPVQVIRREDIERSGAQTVEDLLAQISANFGGQKLAESIGSDSRAGFSGASLRGLGSQSTLVLLDGRRLANYAFSEQDGVGVDLNAIPLEAVERVEVLKDGASAIYGTDAIGGVINFILRKDYRGGSMSLYRGNSQSGGGGSVRSTATLGLGDLAVDRYNVFAILDYQKASSLAARDRAFAATAYLPAENLDRTSNSTFPANIGLGRRRFANPAAPACTDQTVFKSGGCAYDYARVIDLVPPSEQWKALVAGTWQVTPDHEVYAQFIDSRNRAKYTIAAAPISFVSASGAPIVLPASSPFYPQGLGLSGDLSDVRYRTVPLGPRVSQSVSENRRALLGMKGTLAGWDYDTAFVFNGSKAVNTFVSGYVSGSGISNAFATGLINPFGDSGPVGDALLASTELRGTARVASGITRGVDARASRELLRLPAGPLAAAIGIEARRETLTDTTEPIASDAAGGGTRAGKDGSRSVEAAFVELSVPLLRGLDGQLALRGDRYSDFGTTLNPKLALRWQPLQAVLLRASYGRGFRAPSLPELFTAQTTEVAALPNGDPVRCPVTGQAGDCGDNVISVRTGGNPALKPEHSEQVTAGLVLQPMRGLSASIDFWKLRLNDTIAPLTQDVIFANDAAYEGTNILRGPVDPAYPTLPGPVTGIVLLNQNIGATRTHGLDVAVGYRSDATSLGRFTANVNGTYVQQWKMQLATADFTNFRAAYAAGFVAPRWQHYLALGWEYGAFTSTLGQAFQTGYADAAPDASGNARHVASYETWNAQVAYGGLKNTTVAVGVKNLTDRAPPFTNQTDYFQVGYNPNIADPRGRFWYANLVVRFR
jgi:iron complex outermembrane receptor protein